MFTPSRLTLARKRRGLSKKQLAEVVGLQWRSISAFENGEYPPSDETLSKIASRLGFPNDFFFGDDADEPSSWTVSFRAMSRMSARQRYAALGAGAIAFMLNDWVEARFDLSSPDFLDLREEDPEAAAMMLRQYWGIGERPISNMIHLLEAKGARIFSLTEDNVEVDAFSLWRNNVPYVFLNTFKSTEHSRFDAAHELGHLVLHKHGGPYGQQPEKEAHQFASAFLMPKASVIASAPALASLRHLIELKKKWTVSVVALAHRLHALNLLSDWHYRTLCIEMSERGYRTAEPHGAKREVSQAWDKIFSALRAEGISKADVARELRVAPAEIEKLVFGLVTIGLTTPAAAPVVGTKPRGRLRAVD